MSQAFDSTLDDAAKSKSSAITNDLVFFIQQIQQTYHTIELIVLVLP